MTEARQVSPTPAQAPPLALLARPDLERAIAAAWREVLAEDSQPGLRFDEAGGDSLKLMTMVFVLEARLGRKLPLDAFLADADTAGMAQVLDGILCGRPILDVSPEPSLAGSPGTVFLLPGAGGDTPGLAALRASCRPAAEVQVLDYPGWREMVADRMDFQSLAAALLRRIRNQAPTGGVTLIGYSLGAPLATEAAFGLENEGRPVRLVVLDLTTPRYYPNPREFWAPPASMREVWWEIDRIRRYGLDAKRGSLFLAWCAASRIVRPVLRALASRQSGRTTRPSGHFRHWTRFRLARQLRLQAATSWASKWRPPDHRLRAPTFLVRTTPCSTGTPEDLGWGEVAERVKISYVPGDHTTMLSQANLPALATAVQVALRSRVPLSPGLAHHNRL